MEYKLHGKKSESQQLFFWLYSKLDSTSYINNLDQGQRINSHQNFLTNAIVHSSGEYNMKDIFCKLKQPIHRKKQLLWSSWNKRDSRHHHGSGCSLDI